MLTGLRRCRYGHSMFSLSIVLTCPMLTIPRVCLLLWLVLFKRAVHLDRCTAVCMEFGYGFGYICTFASICSAYFVQGRGNGGSRLGVSVCMYARMNACMPANPILTGSFA